MRGEILKGHLDMLLLAAVQGRPAHGYAIIEALRRLSGGTFDLPEGTAYPALHRLERAGLLASDWTDHAGRPRRVYRLTEEGERAFRRSAEEWSRFSTSVGAVLGRTS